MDRVAISRIRILSEQFHEIRTWLNDEEVNAVEKIILGAVERLEKEIEE